MKKGLPKAVYLIIAYLIYLSVATIGGVLFRRINEFWQNQGIAPSRLYYDLYAIGMTVLFVSSIVGIIRLREWGRQLVIAVSCIWIFITIIMPIGISLIGYFKFDYLFYQTNLDNIIIALLSVFSLYVITRANVRKAFLKASPANKSLKRDAA